jgi:EAL and modified HD-GYP domain-containing signal transduction protein
MFAYVARQAIYDTKKRVFAYELLFRDGVQNCFPDISPDEATSSMLAGSHLSIGVENITMNKPAFINFHQDTLLYRFPSTLDPLNVVIEIVETVEVNPELIAACEHITNLGYKIALDDYDFAPHWEVLMPLVSYIKLEVDAIDKNNPAIMKRIFEFKKQGKTLIAEKVETIEEYEDLKEMGFHYFQGYFLSRPEMVKHKNIEVSVSSIVELVGISVSKEFDLKKVNTVFEKDVGLSFKLMRFINNPLFNKRQKIDTLAHALKYLGQVELKKFIALLAIANLKGNKPLDLILTSLARAHFCKLLGIAMKQKEDPPHGFLLGLFSLIDALLDKPMPEIMKSLPFSEEIKAVLCQQNTKGLFAQQHQLCIAFERADWKTIDKLANENSIEQPELFSMYYKSVAWADGMKATFT